MKLLQRCIGITIVGCHASILIAASTTTAPYIAIRPQGQDNVTRMLGQAQHKNLHGMHGKFYASGANTTAFIQSVHPQQIAESLFGDALYNKQTLKIKGSTLPRNPNKDLLAEWFYLPSDFDGTLCVSPRVTQFTTDFDLYLSMDKIGHGMYWELHLPVAWTKWDVDLKEHVANDGNVIDATGFGPPDQLVKSFLKYSCYGKSAPNNVTYDTTTNGIAYPLCAARICSCGHTKAGIADVHSTFGWNFFTNPWCHTGLYLHTVAPLGTRPSGDYLFEPVIGNGKHWQVGGGLSTHAILWRQPEYAQELGFYLDARITHPIRTRQKRFFDLKEYGSLSRYMLLFNQTAVTTNMTPAANLTRAEVTTKRAVYADIVALFNYTSDTISWDFGYNLWAQSCEKIDCCDITPCSVCSNASSCISLDGKTWGPYRQDSTIYTLGTEPTTKKFSTDDLDSAAAETRGISHKLFTHLSYNWWDLDGHSVPFFGVGAQIEFGHHNNTAECSCDDSCSCADCALSQWGIWLKGGLSF